MGRLNTNIILLFIIFTINISAQVNGFDSMPKETISIQTNTIFFVTGESLFYKINCFANHKSSSYSKIAYVLLINDVKKIIFKQKIKLESGYGSADYYLPTSLKTGNYKLIAYTNWMKNNKEQMFVEKDLYIVNPFINNKVNITSKTRVDSLVKAESLSFIDKLEQSGIKINTKNDKYFTRSSVSIQISNANSNMENNRFCMSVRKVDSIELIKDRDIGEKRINSDNKFYIPELRGEIISGKVVSKNTGHSKSNQVVSLSMTGNRDVFKTSKTNTLGVFYFNLNENYNSGDLIFQINAENAKEFDIVIDKENTQFIEDLKFSDLIIDESIANWIREKNLSNQIEAAYSNLKKDSIINIFNNEKFYGKPDVVYVLDDYKRFKTVKEIFVEIIEGAGIKSHKGKQEVVVYSAESIFNKQLPDLKTLLVVDGMPIFEHVDFINMEAKDIVKIALVKETFFHGPSIYKNILIVETKNRNFLPDKREQFLTKYINSVEKYKVYYEPDYENKPELLKHIPDFRNQLFWNANIDLSNKLTEIDFFTSDIKGLYEIRITGFINPDKEILLRKYFIVE